jgi:AcrR family transcriptional regulator
VPRKATARAPRVSRSDRAEQLLDVTLELIANHGFDAVSAQAIAREAGTTKPVMYRIYPGLHALLLALLVREHGRVEAALDQVIPRETGDQRPPEVLTHSLARLLAVVSESPLTWRLVLFADDATPDPLSAAVARRREQLIARARELVRWGAGFLPEGQGLDEDVIARMLVSCAEECARIVLDGDSTSADGLVSSARALLEGIEWLSCESRHFATGT